MFNTINLQQYVHEVSAIAFNPYLTAMSIFYVKSAIEVLTFIYNYYLRKQHHFITYNVIEKLRV